MKNILCYGDSNAWGNIADSFNPDTMLHDRYEYGVRWTSIVQKLLGPQYHFIEANLNGRSTSFDEIGIVRPSRNGLSTLAGILEMHYPLDLVIFMLGTNDLKIQYNASVERIADGMRQLIHTVKNSLFGRNNQAPHILLIAPSPIIKMASPLFALFFDDTSVEKSNQLALSYEKLAKEERCEFLDAKLFVKISSADGIHIEQDSHVVFAEVVSQKLRKLIEV